MKALFNYLCEAKHKVYDIEYEFIWGNSAYARRFSRAELEKQISVSDFEHSARKGYVGDYKDMTLDIDGKSISGRLWKYHDSRVLDRLNNIKH